MAIVALAAAALALLARWQLPPRPDGGRFEPRPDALEYAAGAQSIAQDGRYLLHVGPTAVRPRYPPGFSMLLAGALRAGLAPERLHYVTGLADAALSILVAAAAALVVVGAAAALGGRGPAVVRGALVAAALGGLVVALGTWHVRHAKLLHGDAPVALGAALALLAWGLRFRAGGPPARARRRALELGAGLLFGWVAVARPIEGALLAPALALAPFLLGERDAGRIARAALVAAAGAALPVALAATLLVRSGEAPLAMSAYELWAPEHYAERGGWLGWRYVVGPSPVGAGPRADWPGWRTALSSVTGVPIAELGPGPVWPLAGWIGLFALLRALRRARGPAASELAGWLALAGIWSLGHALFFPFYFYPARRFYLVAAHVATALAAAMAGLLLARGRRAALAGAALAVAIAAPTLLELARHVRQPDPRRPPVRAKLERRFEAWLARGDAGRARAVLPLDPVQAQAFGWLDRERAESIGEWGRLPDSLHVRGARRIAARAAHAAGRPPE